MIDFEVKVSGFRGRYKRNEGKQMGASVRPNSPKEFKSRGELVVTCELGDFPLRWRRGGGYLTLTGSCSMPATVPTVCSAFKLSLGTWGRLVRA